MTRILLLALLVMPGCSSKDGDPCPHGIECYADFPCLDHSLCHEGNVVVCNDIPCEVVCGTPCCAGAECGGWGEVVETCTGGEVCMERIDSSDGGRVAGCQPGDASTDGWSVPDEPSLCQ